MDLVLIRHARPALPAGQSSVCYGRLDLPLAAPCSPTAAQMAGPLLAYPPARIVTSPAMRARDTAALLAQMQARSLTAPVPCQIEPRLQELDFGAWEGQPWDAIARADLDAWAADLMGARPHGGESAAQVMARVSEWAGDAETAADACWWVVAHAGPIRMLAAHWLGVPLAQTLQWSLGFGASCCLRLQAPQAQLVWWNRTVD